MSLICAFTNSESEVDAPPSSDGPAIEVTVKALPDVVWEPCGFCSAVEGAGGWLVVETGFSTIEVRPCKISERNVSKTPNVKQGVRATVSD